MLLRIGVIAMSFSVMLALMVAVIVSLRDKPEEVVAAEPVASEPGPKSGPEPDPRDKMLDLPAPESGPQSEQPKQASDPELTPETEAASGQNSARSSVPDSGSTSEPASRIQPAEVAQEQNSLPLAGADWPVPSRNEIEQASKPRHYGWVPGAVLTLTVKSIGLHNAPVMGTDSQQALDNGVVHVPETSLPWTRSPHRNVYLAGHRLGWTGTGSRLIFYNLNKLQRGDEVVLKDRQDRRYRYRVSDVFVVGFDDRWVMGQVRGRDMVTLQTCTGPNFSQRLIVRADRV